MENRKGTRTYLAKRSHQTAPIFHSLFSIVSRGKAPHHTTARTAQSLSIFPFLVFIFPFLVSIFFFVSWCGAPGEPTPPSPPVPAAVAYLTARQAGDGVELVFTLPSKSVSGDKLSATPAVEILRGTLNPDTKPDPRSFRV